MVFFFVRLAVLLIGVVAGAVKLYCEVKMCDEHHSYEKQMEYCRMYDISSGIYYVSMIVYFILLAVYGMIQ